MNALLDWTLSVCVVGGIAIAGVAAYIGIVILKLLPWLIKIGVLALLAYFGLSIFGLI